MQFARPASRRARDSSPMRRAALCLLLPAVLAAAQDQSIFPDKALEAVVRKSVFEKRNTNDPILAKDVERISTIKGSKAGIRNIEGLQHCRELRELNLSENEIEDVSPLAGLKYLQSLDLAKNKISSIEPLRDHKMLQFIELSHNQVSDLSPLENHETVVNLYLENNKVSDISVVATLPRLVSLYLDDNPVRDVSPLAKLKWLERVGLNRCQVEDVAPLTASIYWKYIFLEDNKIADLAPLVEMCKRDLADRKRFAPFVRIYLNGNPLSEQGRAQLEELKALGIRLRSMKDKD